MQFSEEYQLGYYFSLFFNHISHFVEHLYFFQIFKMKND
jgi:hypothetical protein